MKKINNIYKILGASAALFMLSCNNDLDQTPPNIPSADSLTEFSEVLNAAYFYQHASATPIAVMGDFRADNALMYEEPYPAFDRFNADLAGGDLENQFFAPIYTDLYNSILSANNVIDNSSETVEVGEALFLRALSYFKLVIVFGDVTVNLDATPTKETIDSTRQPAEDIYNQIIIPDLEDAIEALDGSIGEGSLGKGRASRLAAQALLGKVYMYLKDFGNAQTYLETAMMEASSLGVVLEENFADVVTEGSSEIIYSIPITTEVGDNYGDTEFESWFAGNDTKSNFPVDIDLVNAFDDSSASGNEDLRKNLTVGETTSTETTQTSGTKGVKYPAGPEQDYVELRLSDIVLLYAEALNENGSSSAEVLALLDPIRTRAGLDPLNPAVINTQAMVAQAIQDERRLELAFEGQRWFDLVRTGTVNAEMGETIDPVYNLFPIPNFNILATGGIITQNPGY